MKEEFLILEQRQMNQISLDTFTFGKENILDSPVDKLIQNLKTQINEANSEHNRLIELKRNNSEKFNELEEQANQTKDSLYAQMYGHIQDIIYLEDELFALFEMKIIYSFKHLEINIKKLLSAAYQDNYIDKQFKWETIIQFLNSKKLSLTI